MLPPIDRKMLHILLRAGATSRDSGTEAICSLALSLDEDRAELILKAWLLASDWRQLKELMAALGAALTDYEAKCAFQEARGCGTLPGDRAKRSQPKAV